MLQQSFYLQNAPELAKALLGCELVHKSPDGIASGIIVETESYTQDDAASHSYKGQTERTKAMFGLGGHAYIYFTYGMHYCFNVVSGPEGHGQGVLIRALEPTRGIALMQQRRGQDKVDNLCNGPAKLVQALGITKAHYGVQLYSGDLYINERKQVSEIATGPRVGISKEIDKPWRFWIKDHAHVSK